MNIFEKKVKEIDGSRLEKFPLSELVEKNEPVIVKGFARRWPIVLAGIESPRSAMDYLLRFCNKTPLVSYIGAPEIQGRFGYNKDLTGLNFDSERMLLEDFFRQVTCNLSTDNSPSFYIGSTTLDACLPGFRADNDLLPQCASLGEYSPLASIWLGNQTVAKAHFDKSDNIACSLVGKRRFILFPPDQIANLYPGPLEPTPGGGR